MSLTQINSQEVFVERQVSEVFHFLCDLRNYEKLMPDDVVHFEAEPHLAKLNIKGLGSFDIEVSETLANQKITLQPKGKLPFDFDIQWFLKTENNQTVISGQVNANLNAFMKMMAGSRLKDFVSSQASKMKNHLETSIPKERS
jgi:carbon monoxide dehydrogenase subunit G